MVVDNDGRRGHKTEGHEPEGGNQALAHLPASRGDPRLDGAVCTGAHTVSAARCAGHPPRLPPAHPPLLRTVSTLARGVPPQAGRTAHPRARRTQGLPALQPPIPAEPRAATTPLRSRARHGIARARTCHGGGRSNFRLSPENTSRGVFLKEIGENSWATHGSTARTQKGPNIHCTAGRYHSPGQRWREDRDPLAGVQPSLTRRSEEGETASERVRETLSHNRAIRVSHESLAFEPGDLDARGCVAEGARAGPGSWGDLAVTGRRRASLSTRAATDVARV